jgi:hypothetical protein
MSNHYNIEEQITYPDCLNTAEKHGYDPKDKDQ